MEKIIKTYEEDRYELRTGEGDFYTLQEYLDLDSDENLEIVFNLNHSGLRDFHNFLDRDEHYFDNVEQIRKMAADLGLENWVVLSFYQENGYIGLYTNTGDKALDVKCNNWVNDGADGYLYVIFGREQKDIDNFLSILRQYINEGINYVEVYDNLDEDYLDSFWFLGSTYEEYETWKKQCIKTYGFDEDDFEY